MRVQLANRQSELVLDEQRLLDEVEALLQEAGWPGEISLALVTDRRMREMNQRFLGRDETTDVLAFPLEEEEGEIVVSAERALVVARRYGVDPLAEVMLYIVHGILHLVGYDDGSRVEARRMHARSLKLLRDIGYRNRISSREREGSSD